MTWTIGREREREKRKEVMVVTIGKASGDATEKHPKIMEIRR
jgi:hypothetical protein